MTFISGPTMEAVPIDDSAIEHGNPTASGATLYTSPDGRTTVGLFTCTPGRFHYQLDAEEVTHLLSGRIVIHPEGGEIIDARAGDTFILPAHQRMVIDVRETITDIYVTWSPQ